MPSSKRKHQRHFDFHYHYSNPMAGMVKTVGRTAVGVAGIGAITSIGLGALGAIKK